YFAFFMHTGILLELLYISEHNSKFSSDADNLRQSEGSFPDLFTIGFGWIIFGGLPFDFWNVIGQCLGFAGSGLYAYFKLIGK
ncbi:UDP-N-acetylglucosamine/UDP-glucose/GDP-mannose transporter-like, partial [Trifolium medium]|nr:UDP-N-acetylglucosamine/UDP-glucose/GDP-mannose transporter-like [Trifolium medium]